MSKPIWIDCDRVADVASPQELAVMANRSTHVVLRFQSLSMEEKKGLIDRLSVALPDYSVFDSSGGLSPARITVKLVVAEARVMACRDQVLQAIAEYCHLCITLIALYRGNKLPSDWQTEEHGGHCRFTNQRTGQVVEAPLGELTDEERENVDPYFFAEFVKTTAGHEAVAELIEDYYHDARRILEVLSGD